MNHLDEPRIVLHPLLQVVRVFRLQLGAQVGIPYLQPDGHAAVPLQDLTTVIALQLLCRGPLDRPKQLLQATATLHVLQGAGQLCSGDPLKLIRKVMAQPVLLPIPALAHHLNRLLAHRLRAVTDMTRSHAFVAADGSWFSAALLACLPGCHTLSLVTLFDALVLLTRQLLVAWHSTTKAVLATRNRASLLMISVAIFRSLNHARRTDGTRVTIMKDCMRADMTASTGLIADRFLGATGHWRVQHLSPTLTLQFVEGGTLTGQTVAGMTCPLTLVLSAT